MAELRLAATYVAVVLTIAWSTTTCTPPGSSAPAPTPTQTDRVSYMVHAPAGTLVYTGPSTTSTQCPATNRPLDGLLVDRAAGGWVAVGTDDYIRASDGVSPCLRQTRVWLHSK